VKKNMGVIYSTPIAVWLSLFLVIPISIMAHRRISWLTTGLISNLPQ